MLENIEWPTDWLTVGPDNYQPGILQLTHFLPSDPMKMSFLGLVLVGRICTVEWMPSMVTTWPEVVMPGIAMTVLESPASLELMWSMWRTRLVRFWALSWRLRWSWNTRKLWVIWSACAGVSYIYTLFSPILKLLLFVALIKRCRLTLNTRMLRQVVKCKYSTALVSITDTKWPKLQSYTTDPWPQPGCGLKQNHNVSWAELSWAETSQCWRCC